MGEEVAWIGISSVTVRVRLTRSGREGRIIKDDDFIDGEDGEGTSNSTWLGHSLVGSSKTDWSAKKLIKELRSYFVRTLLGIATDTVHGRPPSVGLKVAEGLKDVVSWALWPVFRFYSKLDIQGNRFL
jgi:hypothetical protein